MFDDLIKFMSKLVRRAEAPETPKSVKNEIKVILEKTAADVAAGTRKIEDQIEELKQIEQRLFEQPDIPVVGKDPLQGKKPDDSGLTLKPVTEKVVGQEPLDELLADLAKKTGASQEEVRRVLIDRANEGYLPGDPKRMLDEDDEMLRAYIQTEKLMNREEDLMLDILENAEIPEEQLQGIRALAEEDIDVPPMPDETRETIESLTEMPATFKDLGKTDVGIEKPKGMIVTEDMVDRALDANKQKQRDLERAEELMMDPENFGKSFDEIMQMVQDEKVIPFMKFAPNPRTKKSAGGLAKLFARMGMKAPDKVADVKQTKNIIRDPETDLSRRPDTPREKRTIDELEQMFMDDPRYTGMNAKEMQKLIDKEKIRADVSYNMDIAPEDIPDDMIEMLYQEGYHLNFANGGGVGSLFKRRK